MAEAAGAERAVVTERGSATVLGVAAMGTLVSLLLVSTAVIGALTAATRAASIADLAALAAARAAVDGTSAGPCPAARSVAARLKAALASCSDDGGGQVTVTVSLPVRPRLPGLPVTATARARAGPAP